MRAETPAIAVLCMALGLAGPARAEKAAELAPAPPQPGQATLPLPEFLRLYRAQESAAPKPNPSPPLRAALQSAKLTATLLQDALEVEAALEVVVLAEDGEWTTVELLEVSSATHLAGLPAVEGGMLVVRDGKLLLLSRQAGRYSIAVGFLERAATKDALRSAHIALPRAAPAELRVRYAPELFALAQEAVRQDAGGALILPREGVFEIAWRMLESRAAEPEPSAPVAAAEPSIAHAHASSVATLEGERITRVAYDLRFSGRRALVLELPAGDTATQAYLNGRSVPFAVEGRSVTIAVAPARLGGDRAQLELVLTHALPPFLLSGALHFELPAPSWPTSELSLAVHLPEVFEYEWSGGSLSPEKEVSEVSYVYEIPQPGRTLGFHQYLVRHAIPDVALRYTVDLSGQYYERPTP